VKKPILHIKKQITSLIANGEIKEAVTSLVNLSDRFPSKFSKDIQLISCRYHHHEKKVRLGLSNDESVFMRVALSILELLDLSSKKTKIFSKKIPELLI